MKDFNFFNELMPKKKKKASGSTYMVLVVLLLIAAIGGATYYFYMELDEVRGEVDALNSQLNDQGFVADYEEALDLQSDLQQAESEIDQIRVLHAQLDGTRVIDNLLINEISLAKPNTVSLSTINFNERNVNLEGFATDKDSIARFELFLRSNDRFVGPFIPNIQRVADDEYLFTLSFNIDVPEFDGGIDEQDVDDETEEEDDVNGED